MKQTNKFSRVIFALIFACTAVLSAGTVCRGEIPALMNYQGYLTDDSDKPLTDWVFITLSLYGSEIGEKPLWSETHEVFAEDSLFSVLMGSVVPLNLTFDRPYYLGVAVGDDEEMTPRYALSSAAYALGGPTGPQGPKGEKGDTGPQGEKGDTGNTGPQGLQGEKGDIGMTWQGAWQEGVGYLADDAVSYDGAGYICLQDHTSSSADTPSNTALWDLFVAKGDQGLQGIQGIQGIQGEKGDQGLQGIQGIQGEKGDTGNTGPQGLQGEKGDIGMTWQGAWQEGVGYLADDAVSYDGAGYICLQDHTSSSADTPSNTALWDLFVAKGDQGLQGIQGIQGEKGDQGLQGPQGIQGEKGDQGLQGIQGIQGEKGDTGNTGPQGLQGEKGDIGMTWQGAWQEGVTYLADDAVSYDGAGYICLQDHTSSSADTPSNTALWDLFAAKGEKGEKGDKGDQGLQGIQGIQGEKGDQGLQGIQGEKGDKGDQGLQGIQGEKGDKGDQGLQGIQGIQGKKGDQGEKGEKGDTGEDGQDADFSSLKIGTYEWGPQSFNALSSHYRNFNLTLLIPNGQELVMIINGIAYFRDDNSKTLYYAAPGHITSKNTISFGLNTGTFASHNIKENWYYVITYLYTDK